MDEDPLLTVAEVATRVGLSPSSWRAYVATGGAPAPDDPDDDRPANRRQPRWRASTVDAWTKDRRPRGRPRKAPEGTPSD
jgi:predicted DNA-binding transcriptional regulator AlpA